jgi:transposase-like protein
MVCPRCGEQQVRKNGRDRRGVQVYECCVCHRSFTPQTGTPFASHRFPPDIIALAVRWYLRYRLSFADLAELLAERGVHVHRSTNYLWVQRFTPLYQEAARPYRHAVRGIWHTDETYVKVAGEWRYVYRAIDELGQVIDTYVSKHRDADAATTFFRQAVQSTDARPRKVTTDKAAAYPPALEAILPEAEHVTGKWEQQGIERDHQHLKGRIYGMRGFKTDATAQVVCSGHGFMRNVRDGFYTLGVVMGDPRNPRPPRLMRAWDALTAQLLVG